MLRDMVQEIGSDQMHLFCEVIVHDTKIGVQYQIVTSGDEGETVSQTNMMIEMIEKIGKVHVLMDITFLQCENGMHYYQHFLKIME